MFLISQTEDEYLINIFVFVVNKRFYFIFCIILLTKKKF